MWKTIKKDRPTDKKTVSMQYGFRCFASAWIGKHNNQLSKQQSVNESHKPENKTDR